MNTVLGPFDIAAALILLAAVFGYLNHRFLGLPRTIGLTVMGAVASVVVVVMDNVISGAGGSHAIRTFLEDIDFRFVLMEGMLSFLLFAGALHTDIHEMRRSKWSIGVITVVGVLLSTAIVGSGTRDFVTKFWSLIDEILNAVLFLLIGIEVVVVFSDPGLLLLGLAAIPVTLAARAVSVGVPMLALKCLSPLSRGSFPILVLGGVRGGISIALALSVPNGPYKDTIVTVTYVIVLFSVLLQTPAVGLTARRLFAATLAASHD